MPVRRLIRPMTIMVCLVLLAAGCAPGTVGDDPVAAVDPTGRWPCG